MSSGIITSQRDNRLYLFAVLASLALSFWISMHETVINPDAICYLYGAEEFGKSGVRATMQLCPQAIWPFYSMLIYGLTQLTHLSYTSAAFTLDAMLTSISVLLFIAIIKELGGSRRVMWLAAFVILFAHEFNSVRQYIIRDHGYWVCYLASFWMLLRYYTNPRFITALLWSAILLVGTLFRIEGAIFLLVMPFTVWLYSSIPWKTRLKFFFQLNTLTIVICLLLGVWLLGHSEAAMNKLGRVGEVPNQLQHGAAMVWSKYTSTQASVTQNVLTKVSARDAGLVVFLTLLAWYAVNVINNLSWIFALLVGYAWYSNAVRFTAQARIVIISYLVVNLAVTAGFFAENLFLAKRYLIALSLIFMLWVPFALEKLWKSKNKLGFFLATLLIFMSSLGGFVHFGADKEYIRQAGGWLEKNVPANAKLYANDYQLMYYSQHFGTSIFTKIHEYVDVDVIAHDKWKEYDYLALMVSKEKDDKAALVMQEIHLRPLQIFINNKGTRIYIYKIPHEGKNP